MRRGRPSRVLPGKIAWTNGGSTATSRLSARLPRRHASTCCRWPAWGGEVTQRRAALDLGAIVLSRPVLQCCFPRKLGIGKPGDLLETTLPLLNGPQRSYYPELCCPCHYKYCLAFAGLPSYPSSLWPQLGWPRWPTQRCGKCAVIETRTVRPVSRSRFQRCSQGISFGLLAVSEPWHAAC